MEIRDLSTPDHGFRAGSIGVLGNVLELPANPAREGMH
jgi:hypothetical protein